MLEFIATVGSTIAFTVSALLWVGAALITIPDDQDNFIQALQRQGRWNAAAAWFAAIGSGCLVWGLALAYGWL